jgi:hypothetical protein
MSATEAVSLDRSNSYVSSRAAYCELNEWRQARFRSLSRLMKTGHRGSVKVRAQEVSDASILITDQSPKRYEIDPDRLGRSLNDLKRFRCKPFICLF